MKETTNAVSGAVIHRKASADNGVDATALLAARDALTAAPEGARFRWKASCDWINGTHSRSRIEQFFGLGEEQRHHRVFELDADHPELFAATDRGITPVEYVLVGLAGCLTAHSNSFIGPNEFGFEMAVTILSFALLGGIGTPIAPVIGALVLTSLPEILRPLQDFRLVINGLIKSPQRRTVIHDHAQLWTAYGVLDGHETIERYERLDDGSRPDYAEVRQTASFDVGPGTVDLVPPWQIHAEESGAERTVAVIVRSGKPGEFLQNRFDPATNGVWQGYGPVQIPYELS